MKDREAVPASLSFYRSIFICQRFFRFIFRRSMAMFIIISFFRILLHLFSFSSLLYVSHRSGVMEPSARACRTAQPGSFRCVQSEKAHWLTNSAIS